MGWSGIPINSKIYGLSNFEILKREYTDCFNGKCEWQVKEISNKGSHVWFLYQNQKTKETGAEVIQCRRERGEFLWKGVDLTMGPYIYDMPGKWLNILSEEYKNQEFVKEWIRKKEEQKTKETKTEFNEIYECKCKYEIEFSTSTIKSEETFHIKIDSHKTTKRTNKIYRIVYWNELDKKWKETFKIIRKTTWDDCEKKKIFPQSESKNKNAEENVQLTLF